MRVYLRGRNRSDGPRRRLGPLLLSPLCFANSRASYVEPPGFCRAGYGNPSWPKRAGLERDVVLFTAAGHSGLLEVGGISGDVGLALEAVAAPAAVARAQELDRVGDDLDRLALASVLALPLAPLEPALDRDRPSLGAVIGAVLSLCAPDGDVEVVGLVDPLAALAVLAAAVDGHA